MFEDCKGHIQLCQDLFKCWIHGNEVGDVHHPSPEAWSDGESILFVGLMV